MQKCPLHSKSLVSSSVPSPVIQATFLYFVGMSWLKSLWPLFFSTKPSALSSEQSHSLLKVNALQTNSDLLPLSDITSSYVDMGMCVDMISTVTLLIHILHPKTCNSFLTEPASQSAILLSVYRTLKRVLVEDETEIKYGRVRRANLLIKYKDLVVVPDNQELDPVIKHIGLERHSNPSMIKTKMSEQISPGQGFYAHCPQGEKCSNGMCRQVSHGAVYLGDICFKNFTNSFFHGNVKWRFFLLESHYMPKESIGRVPRISFVELKGRLIKVLLGQDDPDNVSRFQNAMIQVLNRKYVGFLSQRPMFTTNYSILERMLQQLFLDVLDRVTGDNVLQFLKTELKTLKQSIECIESAGLILASNESLSTFDMGHVCGILCLPLHLAHPEWTDYVTISKNQKLLVDHPSNIPWLARWTYKLLQLNIKINTSPSSTSFHVLLWNGVCKPNADDLHSELSSRPAFLVAVVTLKPKFKVKQLVYALIDFLLIRHNHSSRLQDLLTIDQLVEASELFYGAKVVKQMLAQAQKQVKHLRKWSSIEMIIS